MVDILDYSDSLNQSSVQPNARRLSCTCHMYCHVPSLVMEDSIALQMQMPLTILLPTFINIYLVLLSLILHVIFKSHSL